MSRVRRVEGRLKPGNLQKVPELPAYERMQAVNRQPPFCSEGPVNPEVQLSM